MSTTSQRRGLLGRCGQCGKLCFSTRGDAQRFLRANESRRYDVELLTAYRCVFGNGIHLGHSYDGLPFVHPGR